MCYMFDGGDFYCNECMFIGVVELDEEDIMAMEENVLIPGPKSSIIRCSMCGEIQNEGQLDEIGLLYELENVGLDCIRDPDGANRLISDTSLSSWQAVEGAVWSCPKTTCGDVVLDLLKVLESNLDDYAGFDIEDERKDWLFMILDDMIKTIEDLKKCPKGVEQQNHFTLFLLGQLLCGNVARIRKIKSGA